ncbi:MAG TPA: adenylate/guanylate cyclase domain-containing protein [Stellaceae bacterium]|nr:adenylate/guanylate cyclase domain-containing protein [Stellaceae bacterium]
MVWSQRLPERVRQAVKRQQATSELIIGYLQAGVILIVTLLYTLSSKGFAMDTMLQPVPWTLGLYAGFTAVRLWLAHRNALRAWYIGASVVVDIAVLMITIWSYHLEYEAPPALSLKAPTLMFAFVLIALRTLRFEVRYVLLAGASAVLGWIAMLLYALTAEGGMAITHDYRDYVTSYHLLVGAEIEKIVAIALVTAILSLAVVRSRALLVDAVTDQIASADLARFFAPEVAARIRATEMDIAPGMVERRDAAILFVDMRGFTTLSQRLEPAQLMSLLSEYQQRLVPVIQAAGGSIDKYLGDGILASFGAVRSTATFAADALRAVEAIQRAVTVWHDYAVSEGATVPEICAAVTVGPVLFGAIGETTRLEYTVLGEVVNLAAKLEKHTKQERARALVSAETLTLALDQGYQPTLSIDPRPGRRVEGVDQPVDLVMIGAPMGSSRDSSQLDVAAHS